MRCTSCGHKNGVSARYCEACGVHLDRFCPHCGSAASPGAHLCDACGVLLPDEPASPLPARSDRRDPDRRIVSVLFCDLVGSTTLAERLDPEDLRDLILAFHAICSAVIRREGGHVKQYLGDGVLAYFGFPVAHENDARAAVSAGLEMVEEVGRVHRRPGVPSGVRLSVRVAIHTGLVVAGDMDGPDHRNALTVVGATPNIAAHLQALAEPNTVVVSESTKRLVEGFFKTIDLGPHEVRSLTAPLRVYEVRGTSGLESRLDVAAVSGLTPLVGRAEELERLLECWRRAESGEGQIVVLGGEPGIGKSRLAHELSQMLAECPHVRLEARCSVQHQQSAFRPLIDLLERGWSLERSGSQAARFEALSQAIAPFSIDAEEALPLLASLLSIPLPDSMSAPELSPKLQRERTLALILSLLGEIARERPLLLIVEDLHWMDPSSLELLGLLFARIRETPNRTLALVTHRPAFRPPWPAGQRVTHLCLGRLSAEHSAQMCELVAGGKGLPGPILQHLREKTDGIPLYVEELTKMILELGVLRECGDRFELDGPLPSFGIPDTLLESLMARLDRLAPVRNVLQLGAALGRTFSYRLLRAVAGLGDTVLRHQLVRLMEADLLRAQGDPPNELFSFKHALLQEAAYESLLKSRRVDVHRRIADTVRREFAEMVRTQPEILAHHYEAAGLLAEAVMFRQRAGEAAMERSADEEAVSHFMKGLELIEQIPQSTERTERELALCTGLGVALMPVKGYAAPDVEKVFSRARALCQESGETRQLFSTLAGLGNFHQSRAELHTALDLAEQRLELARTFRDPSLEMQAHEAVGTVSYWIGNFRDALSHLETGNTIYNPARHRALARVYGQDVGVVFRAYGAQVLWFLGRADEALVQCRESLRLGRELGHPNSLALATDFAAALHMLRGEFEAARAMAEDAIALAREQHFPFWLGYGMIMRGWALALLGLREEGRAQLLAGITSYQGTGAQLGGRFCIAILAEVHHICGNVENAIGVLDGALPTLEKNEDRLWDAEVHRVRGVLHLAGAKPNEAAAEACFRRALEISQRQGAKALELRAMTSLAHLWKERGRPTDAREQLARVMAGLTQGHGTLDLREGQALLEELS